MIKKETINICIVFNDGNGEYIKKCFPTIFSILENNKQEQLRMYVICKGSKREYIMYLEDIFKKYKQELIIIDNFKDKEYLVSFFKKNNLSSFNYGTYFKLLIPLLLPKEIKKVINFDSDDVIVNSNLKELWDLELKNNLVASVPIPERTEKIQKNKKRLNIKRPFRMGGNLYNLEELRKIDFEEVFSKIILDRKEKLKYAELDVLNILSDGRVLYINDKYNYVPKSYKTFETGKIVYHFAGQKIHLYKNIFGVNKQYLNLYERYSILSKYKIEKKSDILLTLNSIYIFHIIIRYLLKFLDFLNMRNKVKFFLFKHR